MRRYVIFVTITFPVFLGQVTSTAVAVAFPNMVSHFDTSLVLAGWVLSVYQLVVISAIPITSRLSDTMGRRATFMLCIVLFVVGSFLCAIAPSMGWLILFRVIQAAGGGGFVSAASGIVSDEFPDTRQKYIGLLSSMSSLGQIAGPNIGAFMVDALGWQSVFWMNIPFSIISMVLCKSLLKADVKRTTHDPLDLLGIGLLSGSVSSIMISLTLMDRAYSMTLPVIVFIIAIAVFLMFMFIRRCKCAPGGVISMDLLTRRPFVAANIYNFVFGMCAQAGIMALMPLYAISVYNMSVFESGLMITPRSVGVMVASVAGSFFLTRTGYWRPIIIGSLGITVGFILLGLEPAGFTVSGIYVTPIVLVMVFALIAGLGAGSVSPASNNACIELMPDKVASIVGLRQVARQIGGAIGISLCTLVLEFSPNMATGFRELFFGFGFLMLISIPLVFFMPKTPA